MAKVSRTKQWKGAWKTLSSIFRSNRDRVAPYVTMDETDRKKMSRALLEVAHVLANAPNCRIAAGYIDGRPSADTYHVRIVVEGVGVIGIGRRL